MAGRALPALGAVGLALAAAASHASPGEHVSRLLLIERHGVRAPLEAQIPSASVLAADWPAWPVRAGELTGHGAAGMVLMGRGERRIAAEWGIVDPDGCPEAGRVRVISNSLERTIASAASLVQGFAPGCGIGIEHGPQGVPDPLFEPALADPASFDMRLVLGGMQREAGPVAEALDRSLPALTTLRRIAGCPGSGTLCASDPHASRLDVTPDGHALLLGGTLDMASGLAELLMLEYLEGMPMGDVGWGRATPRDLASVSVLHGDMLDATSRAPAVARPLSTFLRRLVLQDLTAPDGRAPAVTILVGHDDTIEPLLGLLGIDLALPFYAPGEVPIGGALGFARIDDARGHPVRFRLFFLSQTPEHLRDLADVPASFTPLRSTACGGSECRPADLNRALGGR